VTISGVVPTEVNGEPWDTFITQIYNRPFTMWHKAGDTRTPFDDLETGACDTAETSYPGTLCVFVADSCCDPSIDDDVDDPPVPDPDPDPPPPP
jgi:hypothetical protein